jgi:acetolactate synthase-1/2/3 large subunit
MSMHSGAVALFSAARNAGADICFANPGTTEMPMVQALDETPGMKAVLGLFEGVCTGAADGYGRMLGKPALTLLHLGPGFANGIANLHNAKRARSPIVNLVGQHTASHMKFDSPMACDIESLARPVSGWVRSSATADALPHDVIDAIAHATEEGSVSTLLVPVDLQQAQSTVSQPPVKAPKPAITSSVPDSQFDEIAGTLRLGKPVVFLLGSSALTVGGGRAVARILSSAPNARFYSDTFPARAERGGGLPEIKRLPYAPEAAIEALDMGDRVVLVATAPPVSLFGYPHLPGQLARPDRTTVLAGMRDDGAIALERLADMLGSPRTVEGVEVRQMPVLESALTPLNIGAIVANLLPDDAIVSIEGSTCGHPFFAQSVHAKRHTVMTNTGGSIGQAIPCALGASLACPGQRVVVLQSDGGAQFTVQTLWTLAREQLPVTILIVCNQRYGILQSELARMGVKQLGPQAQGLTEFNAPPVDWVSLSKGYGVPAVRVLDTAALTTAMNRSLQGEGPMLIEMVI